jgi:hypothetical protein
MLHDIHSYTRPGRGTRQRLETAATAERARLNPWLGWRPKRPQRPHVLSVAELAECHCPEICNRDHANE